MHPFSTLRTLGHMVSSSSRAIPPRTRRWFFPILMLAVVPLTACAQSAVRANMASPSSPSASRLGAARLLIPVEGIRPDDLRNSYTASRSGGRTHKAIDIHAPRGTPVFAAADGVILRLHVGDLGGNSIYQLAPDGVTRYYYAHLDRYAAGLREGRHVRRGEVIGYVGDTGNAAPGDYHLHFSIALLSDPARWWEGENLNPYPILRGLARVEDPRLIGEVARQ